MKPGLKGIEIDTTIFRPATFIEMALDNLDQGAARSAALLVVVVLHRFLFDWRTALISLVAIPLVTHGGRARPHPAWRRRSTRWSWPGS